MIKKAYQFLIFLVILIFSFFLTTPVSSLMLKISFEQLVKESDAIVIGKVTRINSFWNGAKTLIYTNVEIDIEEVIKGEVSKGPFIITQIGGKIGDITLWVEDSPEFTEGEKVLLYLESPEGRKNRRKAELQKLSGRKLIKIQEELSRSEINRDFILDNSWGFFGAFQGKTEIKKNEITGKEIIINPEQQRSKSNYLQTSGLNNNLPLSEYLKKIKKALE